MKSIQYYRTRRWFEIDGDHTLRLNHNLDKNSLVFDIGGYKGETAEAIFNKFKCNVWVFEPIEEYSKEIEQKFLNNPKVKVFNFGLSNISKEEIINIQADSSSLIRNVGDKQSIIKLVEFNSFIKENKIKKIDLMDINIEGMEYDLVGHIIETELINIIDNIQIQFHDFLDNSKERMSHIRDLLKKTHMPTYQYDFIWENWKKKPVPNSISDSKEIIEELVNRLDWSMNELKISREREISTEMKFAQVHFIYKLLSFIKRLVRKLTL